MWGLVENLSKNAYLNSRHVFVTEFTLAPFRMTENPQAETHNNGKVKQECRFDWIENAGYIKSQQHRYFYKAYTFAIYCSLLLSLSAELNAAN